MNIPDPITIAKEVGIEGGIMFGVVFYLAMQKIAPVFDIFADIIIILTLVFGGIPVAYVLAEATYYMLVELKKEAHRRLVNLKYKVKAKFSRKDQSNPKNLPVVRNRD